MSQFQWDELEEIKQDIIDGKVSYQYWDFETIESIEQFEGRDNILNEKEMLEVFRIFQGTGAFDEIASETLARIIEDVVVKRKEVKA